MRLHIGQVFEEALLENRISSDDSDDVDDSNVGNEYDVFRNV